MEGAHDQTTLQLVDQALTDRATLLQSELDRVTKLQAVVTAMQAGDKPAIQAARDAAKTSMEAVVASAKIFSQDVRKIREHLRSVQREGRPTPPSSGATPATTVNE
jgi:hypothetical protein